MLSEFVHGPNDSFTLPDDLCLPNRRSDRCDWCGSGLYQGESVYDFPGEAVCESCVDNLTVAELLAFLDIGKRRISY